MNNVWKVGYSQERQPSCAISHLVRDETVLLQIHRMPKLLGFGEGRIVRIVP